MNTRGNERGNVLSFFLGRATERDTQDDGMTNMVADRGIPNSPAPPASMRHESDRRDREQLNRFSGSAVAHRINIVSVMALGPLLKDIAELFMDNWRTIRTTDIGHKSPLCLERQVHDLRQTLGKSMAAEICESEVVAQNGRRQLISGVIDK
jgi:hypothetical protein